jgi:argininosuccinate synthase
MPATLDGEAMAGCDMVQALSELAGEHGIGRIDHIEDRLIGIKSREVYEAPAAVTLLHAHQAIEALTLSKQQLAMKARIGQEYASLIYDGLWFTAHHQDLASYVQSTQRHVTGVARVRLYKGQATVIGSKSPRSLYAPALATYEEGDQYDQSAAEGFIHVWGLPVRVQAQAQLLTQPGDTLRIAAEGSGVTRKTLDESREAK